MKYVVEKGIELLKPKTNAIYPFGQMEVGDSFIIYEEYSRFNMQNAGSAARAWAYSKDKSIKFACRKTDDYKIRIWRIK